MSHEQQSGGHDSNGAAQNPDVMAAEQQVRQARDELRKAQDHLDALWREATQEGSTRFTLGAVFDDVLKVAKKYPLPSLAAAVAIGFCCGRLFRR